MAGKDREQGRITRLEEAVGYFARLFGLAGFKYIPEQYALVFRRCRSVHTMWMRCFIDAVYVGEDGRVLTSETLAPWKLGHAPRGTRDTWELAAGQAAACGLRDGVVAENAVAQGAEMKQARFRARPWGESQ